MNKAFAGVCGAVLGAAMVLPVTADTAFEGQPIGSIEIRSPVTNLIVSVAFKALSPDESAPVTAANLVSTANLTNGDTLYVFNGTDHNTWHKTDTGWAEGSGDFNLDANGTQNDSESPTADSVSAQIGTGFWLIRQDVTNPFYIFGAVVDLTSTTAKQGLNLMGNPLRTRVTATVTGATKGDTIQIPAVNGMLKLIEYNGSKWSWWEGSTYWQEDNPPAIDPGIGFWYNAQSSGVEFTWKEVLGI